MAGDIRVLFVCLGNICRSPTAQGVFEKHASKHPLAKRIVVDSAGTGNWHVGQPPDPRAIAAAKRYGCDISHLSARQVVREDFDLYDFILAMDSDNLRHLMAMKPAHFTGTLCRFLEFAGRPEDMPDPYYGHEDGFDHVYQLCEKASAGLLQHIDVHYG